MSILIKGAFTAGSFIGLIFTTEQLTIDLSVKNIVMLMVCAIFFSWGLIDISKKVKRSAVKSYKKLPKLTKRKLLKMLENDLVIILITSTVGSLVRIAREWNSKTLTLPKTILILVCSITIAYLIQGLLMYLLNNKQIDLFKYIGHIGIVGGIVSLEIVNLFITEIPNVIKKLVSKKN